MRGVMKSPRPALKATVLLLAVASLSACMNLAPHYERPASPVPSQLPAAPGAEQPAAEGSATLAWRDFVQDPALRAVVEQALANNRDLRVALLNVERARAQLGASQAERWPTVGVGLTGSRAPNTSAQQTNAFTAGVQVSAWEADFFGRISSLNDAARAQLLASEAGRRSAELALVSTVINTALSLRTDVQLQALVERSVSSREDSLKLTRLRFDAGATSQLELQTAESLVAQARTALAQAQRQRAQDLNTLQLLTGQAVEPAPGASNESSELSALAAVPVGQSSEVLLRRPDVIQAEQQLMAANANIGAARAAFFPKITLTAQAGQASSQFSDLFEAGHFAWSLAGQLIAPIFDAGRNRNNLAAAQVSRDIAVAQYEKAIQSAFKDTADALAGLGTWRDQVAAQTRQRDAARDIARLTQLRYDNGAASELERLDAERSVLSAEQALLQAQLAEQVNRVALFKAMGA
jgi:outer membrane protein, multidrug efflux system